MTDRNPDNSPQVDTLLVIDDDDNWCFISKRLLRKVNACNNIITAQNGLNGIENLKDLAAKGAPLPAVIFLDIKMPVMDGFEFLRMLAETPDLDLSHTRIYICSSSLHPRDRERVALFNVAGFLTKPLTEATIQEIL